MTAIPICTTCWHYRGKLRCEAFPDRIPDAILENRTDHRKPADGDHGITFAAKDQAGVAYAADVFDKEAV